MLTSRSETIRVTATGTALARRARVQGFLLTGGSTAASVAIRDGGAAGPILIEFNGVPAGVTDGATFILGPVLFNTDVHVTLTGTGASVIVYFF